MQYRLHTEGQLRTYYIMVLMLFLACSCTSTKQISNGWENHYLGAEEGTLFFPDNYSSYWVFTFNPKKYPNIGFRIRGKQPSIRYLSFNLYHHKSRTSLGSLADNSLFSDSDSYEAVFLPDGIDYPGKNIIHFKKDIGRHSIFLRYYDPLIDKYGGVSLPDIEAFDVVSGDLVPLPHLKFNVLSSRIIPKVASKFIALKNRGKPFNTENRLHIASYKHSGKGFFPNLDNQYLIVPVDKRKDEVAILRFIPPGFSSSLSDTAKDVRYWSLALGMLDTQNPYTLIDREAIIADDGFVYVLLGEDIDSDDPTPYNHIPWLAPGRKTVFLYRNLLSKEDYKYAISNCPEQDTKNPSTSEASLFLGNYAPRGLVLKKEVFKTEGFSSIKRD